MPQTGVAAEVGVVSWTGACTQILVLALAQAGGPLVVLTQEANTGGVTGYCASVGSSFDAVKAALVAVTAFAANTVSEFWVAQVAQ
jgi:hypothetical protein